jgi:ketosteroid isomerase-like protein
MGTPYRLHVMIIDSLQGIDLSGSKSQFGFMAIPLETSEVINRFNQAFTEHDASLLAGLVADDCVMESVEPAPDGTRYEGGEVCLRFWESLAEDRNSAFRPENIVVSGDRAVIRWRYRFGEGMAQSVRGVNLMLIRNGQIVEALGYVKSGEASVADAVRSAVSE